MFVALVLLAWHAIRIPIEGDVATSLAHADDVLGLERALSLDVERSVIGRLDDANVTPALAWLYTNIHLPVLFAFVAAARLLAPARYPVVRTTFALAFLPAALVIWLYPLAPPHWLPAFGFGGAADRRRADEHDRGSLPQHDGCGCEPALRVRGSRRRDRDLALPAVAAGLRDARLSGRRLPRHRRHRKPLRRRLHRRNADAACSRRSSRSSCIVHAISRTRGPQTSGVASIALGYGLVTWGFVSLDLTGLRSWDNAFYALVLVGGVAAVIAPRLAEKEPLTESR